MQAGALVHVCHPPTQRSSPHGCAPRRWAALSSQADSSADVALLERIAHGDPDALEALYERHAPSAYALACWVVGDATLAEDVVQEAFLAIWRQAERFDPSRGAPRCWISTIVRHRGIDALRRRRSQLGDHQTITDEIAGVDSTAGADVEAQVTLRVEGERLRWAMLRLPPAQRQALELAYFDGLSHHEIAAILCLPLGTVKGRLRLALQKLRALLWGEWTPASIS